MHVARDGPLPAGAPYLVLEHVDGSPVDRRARGALGPARVERLAIDILHALDHVHAAGFVHRDVKPGNVLVRGDDDSGAKLIDFGLATPAGLDGLVNALGNYSSAQILMALWLLAAGRREDEDGSSHSAALGFLAGLALAGQLGQTLGIEWNMPATGIEGGNTGGTLDASA